MRRRRFLELAAAGAALAAGVARGGEGTAVSFRARRFPDNPIIHAGMDARMADEARRYGYVNINGPSLIRAPEWVKDPLGKYYLYFAHHKGGYIRLAYSDDPAGPWQTYEPGALDLADSCFSVGAYGGASRALAGIWRRNPPSAAWALTRVGLDALLAADRRQSDGEYGSGEDRPHIASPDVHVDHERREFRMYYHGMLEDGGQMSRVALSSDGIHFEARAELLASPYLRMFRYRDQYYGIGMPGIFYRSADGLSDFQARPGMLFGANMRHHALLLRDEVLYVFFSRVGDAPERILGSAVDLSPGDWRRWKPSPPAEVLRPEMEWEGADRPVRPSIRGEITGPANQLRDPAIFEDQGKILLLYSCAGEQAIALAELEIE